MPATTIDQVLDQLDEIIEIARARSSRLGYFPALYRKVTARVRDAILAGRFEDGRRMEHMDVVFANRYIDAFMVGVPGVRSLGRGVPHSRRRAGGSRLFCSTCWPA